MTYSTFEMGQGLITLIVVAVMVWPAWRIVSKAGYPGALALGLFIPPVNIVLILFFAFSEWPLEKALKRARGEGL